MRLPKYLPNFPYNMAESRERAEVAAGKVDRARRHFMPYGLWVCANGREVLFDRQYRPLFERPAAGEPAVVADVCEWVMEIKGTERFYSDGTPEPEKRKRAIAALQKWGVVA